MTARNDREAADWRGPHDQSILVVVAARLIEAGVKAELCGVAFGEEILSVDIRDEDPLIARVELVEVRVGVLLAHVEEGEIVLKPVVIQVAENPDSEVGIIEDEPTEIAHERLHAEARGDEVVIVA